MTLHAYPVRAGRNFTLLELVAVVAIMATIIAIAAPSLGRMGERADIDSAARMIANALTLLREEAITSSSSSWLVYDVTAGTLLPQVSDPGSQKRIDLSLVVLPEDVRIQQVRFGSSESAGNWKTKKSKTDEAVCYPDGMIDEHTVTLESGNYLSRIEVFSLTGQISVFTYDKDSADAEM